MTRNTLLALIAGTGLAVSGSVYAQTNAPAAKTPAARHEAKKGAALTSVSRGTIKSISDNQIVVEHKGKGSAKDLTLVLNSATQKQGDLQVGMPVTVHYRYDNSQDVATMVRSETARKPTTKTPKGQ